jgi:hypothetical protein
MSFPPKKNKRREFVRPNCSKVYCFQCGVCLKNHYKYGAHFKCYKKWCDLCQRAFETEAAMTKHSKTYHAKNFCEACNQTFEKLKVHKTVYHKHF